MKDPLKPSTARFSARWLLLIASALFAASIGFAQNPSTPPRVVVLHLDDTIQPISQEYLERGIAQATKDHAAALLVDLNTPGGMLTSTRAMVSKILASPVPVIVYVAPSGSRAGSAGFFLLEAADIAAMAPGTNAGASHPVVEGAKLGPIMKQKLENDTTAFLRSFVSRRGRNVDAAQDAVLHSKSYTEKEALQLHLIDIIATSDRALLDALDGRKITRFDGAVQTLHTRGAVLTYSEPTLRERILDRMMNPDLAVLILIVGALLIYLEFHAPGTIIPGALGTLLVLVSLFSLNLLPLNYIAVVLIVAAFVLMILEAKFPSHGILAGAGVIALIFGTLTLVEGPIPELRVHVATAVACGIGFGAVTAFLAHIAVRAQRNKVVTGAEGLLGEIAMVQQPLSPRGQVLVRGELWQAESDTPAASGEMVRVRAVRGLTLLVERVPVSTPSRD
jgi:membrane-bound serine protease (ClpP class)